MYLVAILVMLQQKIAEDLKKSIKENNHLWTDTLRMLIAALHNKEIEKRGKGLAPELSDEETIEVLNREAKKRKEAMEIYTQANRLELSEKEAKELAIIQQYLPEQLSEEKIAAIINQMVEKIGAKTIQDFGKAMAEIMKEIKGKADAKIVSEMLKKKLSGSNGQ